MALDKTKPLKIAPRRSAKRAPAKPRPPKTEVHVPKAVFKFFEYTSHGINTALDFGSWMRRRAGYLALGVMAFSLTHWNWITYQAAKPRLVAQCEDNRYVEAVALTRGCVSEEHCTDREIAHHVTMELAFTYAASHCDAEPWSLHGSVIKFVSWGVGKVMPEPWPLEIEPEDNVSDEPVLVAEQA